MRKSTSGGDELEAAVAGCAMVLRAAVGRDWDGIKAARLEWSCRATAEHIADDLLAYAGQLAGRATGAYVPFTIALDEGTGNADVVDVIETTGALFAAVLRTTPPGVRAFHPAPFLSAERVGFAAMGVAEVLLHTYDIAEGLGVAYQPAPELPEFVLTRIFPEVRPGLDAWRTLLWATGRGELPGRDPVLEWRWQNTLSVPTDRLNLECASPAALAELRAGGSGGFGWLGAGPLEGTRDAAGLAWSSYENGCLRAEFGIFVVVRKEDGRAIGSLGFHSAPDAAGRTEIGYDLVPEARGQGYATEAVRALAARTFANTPTKALFAHTEPANSPSQAVLSRAGFVRVPGEGELIAYELCAAP